MIDPAVAGDGFWLAGPRGGRLHAICHRPPSGAALRGLVLHAHAFADEMNKSRRMAALQARTLATAGFIVLRPDLSGCGDSEGEFAEASWHGWIDDLLSAAAWLRQTGGNATPLFLWGHRVGALLMAEVARRLPDPAHLLFWQPMLSGRVLLRQFLRLKSAGMRAAGRQAGNVDALRAEWQAGNTVDVAGYRIAPALAAGLEAAQLELPASPGSIDWFEIGLQVEAPLPPATAQLLDRWQTAGHPLRLHRVPGPAFWETAEIEDVPALLQATLLACESRTGMVEAA